MATENTNKAPRVTKATAVRAMLDAAIANGFDNAEAIEIVEKMHQQLTTKRTPTGPTKKQRENAALMEQVTSAMRGREPMTLAEITEAFGLPSWQKASALMKAGVAANIVTVNTEGKKNTYSVA